MGQKTCSHARSQNTASPRTALCTVSVTTIPFPPPFNGPEDNPLAPLQQALLASHGAFHGPIWLPLQGTTCGASDPVHCSHWALRAQHTTLRRHCACVTPSGVHGKPHRANSMGVVLK